MQKRSCKKRGVFQTYLPEHHGHGGLCFDGKFIDFVPLHNGGGYHGNVLRYNSLMPFDSSSSWTQTDVTDYFPNARGYFGNCFDGRYKYYAPWSTENGTHGLVLRYDTGIAFEKHIRWSVFDVSNMAVGFHGNAIFNNRLYLVPYRTAGVQAHGTVIEYDCAGQFENSGSWASFNAQIALGAAGYVGAISTPQNLYFVPDFVNYAPHGTVLRYSIDPDYGFTDARSWATFDATQIHLMACGFRFGLYDGQRYIYFIPHVHTFVLRHDTWGDFQDPEMWAVYDIGGRCYGGAILGQFAYFTPRDHQIVMRLNLQGDFISSESWAALDTGLPGLTLCDAETDGEHVYFGCFLSGPVLRYTP
jgi:hypothetical protein